MIDNMAGNELILIPISIDELIDKISILKIKFRKCLESN